MGSLEDRAGLAACGSNASLSQDIFNIAVTEIESVVEPDGVADDIGWKSVAFICVHTR